MVFSSLRSELRGIDLVFVIDATGSMGHSIKNVAARLVALSEDLSKSSIGPQLAFGVVAYRDHRVRRGLFDTFYEPTSGTSFVTRVYPLRDDIASLARDIRNIKSGGGGGDGAEAVVDGLAAAQNKIAWRKYSQKAIILVGDQSPHGMGAARDRWPKGCPCGRRIDDVVARASSRGIVIYAIVVGARPEASQSFSKIAMMAKGVCITLLEAQSLMPRIQSLMGSEVNKTASDVKVFEAWEKGVPIHQIGEAIGLSGAEVRESLDRLKIKGAMPLDAQQYEEFEDFLNRHQRNESE